MSKYYSPSPCGYSNLRGDHSSGVALQSTRRKSRVAGDVATVKTIAEFEFSTLAAFFCGFLKGNAANILEQMSTDQKSPTFLDVNSMKQLSGSDIHISGKMRKMLFLYSKRANKFPGVEMYRHLEYSSQKAAANWLSRV